MLRMGSYQCSQYIYFTTITVIMTYVIYSCQMCDKYLLSIQRWCDSQGRINISQNISLAKLYRYIYSELNS